MSSHSPCAPFVLAQRDSGGDGAPMLLVHGFSHSRVVWEAVAAELPSTLRSIAVDLRGHGDSPWSAEGDYDVSDYAADLPGTLDALGIERAWVVGHSLGGNAATLFAARHPDRVQGLVLVDTGPTLSQAGASQIVSDVDETLVSWSSIEAFRERLEQTMPLAARDALDRMARHGLVRRLDGRYEPRLDPGILASPEGPSPAAALAALEQALWQALAAIRCPVLLVRGVTSAVLSEAVANRMVNETLADARCVTLEGAGHAVMLDAPERLGREIASFTARCRPEPRRPALPEPSARVQSAQIR